MPGRALSLVERALGIRAFRSLSRRVRTLIVAGVLFLGLFVLALTMPVPYVVLSPGPTYNTLGTDDRGNTIIVIGGKKTATTTGHLNLTTVSIRNNPLTAFQVVAGWLEHDKVVLPRTAVYPPGTSEEKTNQQNTEQFIASQDNATEAALCELHYPKGFGVLGVTSTGPSHGILRAGDFFVSINGKPTTSASTLTKVLSTETPARSVPVVVKRAGKDTSLQVKLGPPLAHRTGASLGVSVGTGCLAPFTVDLGLANQIGGPSAGLMFALGIIDKVGTVDLTHGRFIAGTGEIDSDDPAAGKVLPIGGISLKMIAAKAKGASVFLAPAGNCGDVRKATPKGLKVVKVSTVHDAVQDLEKLQQGEPVPGC